MRAKKGDYMVAPARLVGYWVMPTPFFYPVPDR